MTHDINNIDWVEFYWGIDRGSVFMSVHNLNQISRVTEGMSCGNKRILSNLENSVIMVMKLTIDFDQKRLQATMIISNQRVLHIYTYRKPCGLATKFLLQRFQGSIQQQKLVTSQGTLNTQVVKASTLTVKYIQ